MFSSHLPALVASLGAAVTVVVLGRRSVAAAIGATFLALIASNSSLGWLKQPFLTARWAALLPLAVVLIPVARRLPQTRARRLLWLAILPGLALVSSAWSVEPKLTIERAASFGILLWVVVVCGLLWASDPRELRRFTDAIGCVSLIVLGISLVVAVTSQRGFLNGQLRGIFENPNGLGLFLALTYPFLAVAMERRRLVPLQLVFAAAYFAVAFFSDSRSGFVTLAITAVGYELSRRRFGWAGICALGAVGVAAAMILFGGPEAPPIASIAPSTPSAPGAPGTVPNAPKPPVSGAPGPAESLGDRLTGARLEAWRATLSFVDDRPVVGYGFGTGDRIFALNPERVHFVNFQGANPNDAYLQLLLELGALGAVIFLVPLLGACVVGVRCVVAGRSLDGIGCGLALVAGIAAGVVESVFTSAGAPWALLIWLAAAGCVASMAAREPPEGAT